jgi:hypothetical protein
MGTVNILSALIGGKKTQPAHLNSSVKNVQEEKGARSK